jgi:hypothetical protein
MVAVSFGTLAFPYDCAQGRLEAGSPGEANSIAWVAAVFVLVFGLIATKIWSSARR